MNPVKWERVLQFVAGPNETTFHACDEHKECLLDREQMPSLFFADSKDVIHELSEEDDSVECYFCRGIEGP